MYLKLLLCTFVLGISLELGQTCSCFPQSIEELYCQSKFVAKFKVVSNFKVPGGLDDNYDDYYFSNTEGFYRVKMIRKPWKFPANVGAVDMRRLYTASNGAMCGVSLQKGVKYLISGNIYKGEMHISLCSSIVKQTPVGRSIKRLKKNSSC